MAKIPLSKYQFAYQEGKSSVTALHAVVTKLERSLGAKEISLAAFLDIEGAFDNSSHNSMISAMTNRNFDKCIIDWVSEMSKREISANLGNSFISIKAVEGCPQGGLLSPLLWSLIVDDLLKNLESQGLVDALLCLLPLHQFLQLEAEKSALRIKRSVNLLEGDLIGHLSILKQFNVNPLILNN